MALLNPNLPAGPEGRRSRWFGILLAAGVLILLLAIFLPRPEKPAATPSTDDAASSTGLSPDSLPAAAAAHYRGAHGGPKETAEQMVARRARQFARVRREVLHDIARRLNIT